MFWTLKYWQPDTTSDSTGSPCRRLSQTPCPIASPAGALLLRCWLAGAALITLGFLDPVFFSLPVLNIDNVKHTSRPSTASHWCCDERLAAVVGRLLGLRPLGPTAQTLFVRCLMLAACCMVDRCFCPLPWIFPMTTSYHVRCSRRDRRFAKHHFSSSWVGLEHAAVHEPRESMGR